MMNLGYIRYVILKLLLYPRPCLNMALKVCIDFKEHEICRLAL